MTLKIESITLEFGTARATFPFHVTWNAIGGISPPMTVLAVMRYNWDPNAHGGYAFNDLYYITTDFDLLKIGATNDIPDKIRGPALYILSGVTLTPTIRIDHVAIDTTAIQDKEPSAVPSDKTYYAVHPIGRYLPVDPLIGFAFGDIAHIIENDILVPKYHIIAPAFIDTAFDNARHNWNPTAYDVAFNNMCYLTNDLHMCIIGTRTATPDNMKGYALYRPHIDDFDYMFMPVTLINSSDMPTHTLFAGVATASLVPDGTYYTFTSMQQESYVIAERVASGGNYSGHTAHILEGDVLVPKWVVESQTNFT
jgi:hypothetical protein